MILPLIQVQEQKKVPCGEEREHTAYQDLDQISVRYLPGLYLKRGVGGAKHINTYLNSKNLSLVKKS